MSKHIASIRPGPGWKYLGSGTWEHSSSIRAHISGQLVMFKNGDVKNIYQIPGAYDLWLLLLKINGNNAKRAMLALALNVAAK